MACHGLQSMKSLAWIDVSPKLVPFTVLPLLALAVAACGQQSSSLGEVGSTEPRSEGPAVVPGDSDADEATVCCRNRIPEAVTPRIPSDIPADLPRNACAYKSFAWETFLALNWPASDRNRGQADPSRALGATDEDGITLPTVWESYRAGYEVFQDPAVDPCPASSFPGVPPDQLLEACWQRSQTLNAHFCPSADGDKVLPRSSKANAEVLNQWDVIAPLVDQNGNLIRFETRMNFVEFEYIVENGLYDAAKQAKATEIDFPMGSHDDGEGTIEIKAGWMALPQCDDRSSEACKRALSRYLTTEAYAYVNENGTAEQSGGDCTDESRVYGLVMLHIGRKLASTDPQWTFMTFEHVDNVPTVGDDVPEGAHFNLYDPKHCDLTEDECPMANIGPCVGDDCQCTDGTCVCPPGGDCCMGTVTDFVSGDCDYEGGDPSPYSPSQMLRLDPVPSPECGSYSEELGSTCDVAGLNRSMQALVADTPLAHYMLVDAQWPMHPEFVGGNGQTPGLPEPDMLRNVAGEAFMVLGPYPHQKNISSCSGCHAVATTVNGCTLADNSFFLSGEAQCPPGMQLGGTADDSGCTYEPCVSATRQGG